MTLENHPSINAEMRVVVLDLQTRLGSLKMELQQLADENPMPSVSQQMTAALQAIDELP